MIDQFNRLVTILGEIASAPEIIETSEESTADEHTLPAVIVDFEDGEFEGLLEDGLDTYCKPSYSLVIHVEKDLDNRSATRTALFDLVREVFAALVSEYRLVKYEGCYVATVPFGAGDALAFGCLIHLPEEKFEIL